MIFILRCLAKAASHLSFMVAFRAAHRSNNQAGNLDRDRSRANFISTPVQGSKIFVVPRDLRWDNGYNLRKVGFFLKRLKAVAYFGEARGYEMKSF